MATEKKRCTFNEWLDSLFNHQAKNSDEYHDSLEKTYWCNISPMREVAYITQAFKNAESVFASFSNAQINLGLWHLISFSSSIMWALLDSHMLWAERQRCIRSFFNVFEQLFAKRCSPHLSYFKLVNNPLNSICFMWWDVFAFWGKPKINSLFLDVMAATLRLDYTPCQESALHGLGHLPTHREKVHQIIAQFLEDNPNIQPKLRGYALDAKDGYVL